MQRSQAAGEGPGGAAFPGLWDRGKRDAGQSLGPCANITGKTAVKEGGGRRRGGGGQARGGEA